MVDSYNLLQHASQSSRVFSVGSKVVLMEWTQGHANYAGILVGKGIRGLVFVIFESKFFFKKIQNTGSSSKVFTLSL